MAVDARVDDAQPGRIQSPLTFTIATKQSSLAFFEPIGIQVVLQNNSKSSISLDASSLTLIPKSWHVVGTWGQWSGVEGLPLQAEDKSSSRIQLPAGASIRLSTVHEDSSFELLGPVRVAYELSSSDSETRQLLPADERELSFEIAPPKVLAAVWAAKTQADRERTQTAFNDFLRLDAAAKARIKGEEEDFAKAKRDQAYTTKVLFYMAGYALPFLVAAATDKDPQIREYATAAYPYAARAIGQLDACLDDLDALGPRPQWAATLSKNQNRDQSDWRAFALRALNDSAPNVRKAAVEVLTRKLDTYYFDILTAKIGNPKTGNAEQPADAQATARELEAVKRLAKDSDAGVRGAVQEYLGEFADKPTGADTAVEALTDEEVAVRTKALDALLHSSKPPPLDILKRGFASSKDQIALGLIRLLLEQEDSSIASALSQNFTNRSDAERLAIMTAVAGHADAATFDLIKAGLSDPSIDVQRTALLRLLAFSDANSRALIDRYTRTAPADLRSLADAVKTEMETRRLWPFLKTSISAAESVFPSQNGAVPITSPDGQWIAYNETGWGRPGGSGGFGRSNLISIAHVVRINGDDDRVVSDMFLVGWLSDSKRVGTARDAFVAISDFNGDVVSEFGDPLPERYRGTNANGLHWTKADLRSQMGASMPHEKHLDGTEDFGFGEGRAFSPNGEWYGPIQTSQGIFFLNSGGKRLPIKFPREMIRWNGRAVWSPDGRYVQLTDDSVWLIFDMQTQTAQEIKNIHDTASALSCESACGEISWSSDSAQITFLRNGQVWISNPYGENARQLTFDSTKKASPQFARDGRTVAYLTLQPDNYPRLGPTDLWVVDVATTIATRVTAPADARIKNFDWLDNNSLIFDRTKPREGYGAIPRSSLKRLSLSVGAAP